MQTRDFAVISLVLLEEVVLPLCLVLAPSGALVVGRYSCWSVMLPEHEPHSFVSGAG